MNPQEPSELMKLQMDYAWKWFSFHALQRTTMLNFFLIATGVVANAYVTALGAGMYLVAVGICVVGFVISFSFWRLDLRNKQLVGYGKTTLSYLEIQAFRGYDYAKGETTGRPTVPPPIILADRTEIAPDDATKSPGDAPAAGAQALHRLDEIDPPFRSKSPSAVFWQGFRYSKHSTYICVIEVIVVFAFVVAAAYALYLGWFHGWGGADSHFSLTIG
jgi:hypothetical protein